MKKSTAFLILLVVGILVYGSALFNGFVGDDLIVLFNKPITPPFPQALLTFINSQVDLQNPNSFFAVYYRPVPLFYFSIIKSVFGITSFVLRFPIVFLHVVNAFFVYLLFSRFFKQNISFLLALIFLVHPLNQEPVVYIAVAQEVFYFFFGISALLAFTSDTFSIKQKIASCFLFLFALLSKETAVLFLGITLLYEYMFTKKEWLKKAPWLLFPIGVYALLRLYSVFHHVIYIVPSNIAALSFAERTITIPKVMWYYISSFLYYPQNTSILPKWTVTSFTLVDFYVPLILDVLFLAGITAFYLYLRRVSSKNAKHYAFFYIWFIVGMVLHIQIVPLDQTVAARWFYFPMVGVLGMIGMVSTNYSSFITKHAKLFLFIFVCIFAYFTQRTFVRNLDFKDALTLYSKDVNLPGENYYLENNIGDELAKRGKTAEAIVHFKKSLALNPKWYIAWSNLGVSYEWKKDYKKALQALKKATDGNYLPAYENTARILLLHKSAKDAKEYTLLALKKFPNSSTLWLTLALAQNELQEYQEAHRAAQRAYVLSPTDKTQSVLQALQKKTK